MDNTNIPNYLTQIENELDEERARSSEYKSLAKAMSGMPSEENLIKYQLDMREELDRLYHILRGDEIKQVGNSVVYVEQKNINLRPFNDFGVNLLMNIMTSYLNKNTILSYYEEPEIFYPIILEFGNELSDLILERCLEMGMDTEDKIKMYPMIVKELVDSVHNAYRRALFGRELNSLRTARTITQRDDNSQNHNFGMGVTPNVKKRSLNPLS